MKIQPLFATLTLAASLLATGCVTNKTEPALHTDTTTTSTTEEAHRMPAPANTTTESTTTIAH